MPIQYFCQQYKLLMGILTLLNCYTLLYVLLKLQRGAQYIFNVIWGNVFIIVEALLLHK